MIPGVTGSYKYKIDGELTFYGVLDKHYEEIATKWKEKTRKSYGKDYDIHIIPHFTTVPLKSCTLSDFDAAIEFIENNGTRKNKEKRYSKATINHFRYIIKRVVEIGAKHEKFENVLLGTHFYKTKDDSDDPPKPSKKIKKHRLYLTAAERIKILKIIFTDIYQKGVNFALLLMDILGLRNKEACGVLFGDIMEIPDHPGCHVLVVYKSTKGRTRKITLGGKTDNMYRMLPIPPLVYEFLIARKRYIETLIEEKNKNLPKNKKYKIEKMPISCNCEKFWEACTSVQVTSAGRALFHDISFDKESFLYAEEQSGYDDSGYPTQKSATAYIFRRNYCTDLYTLGYLESQQEYLMGHRINNPAYSRPYFRNDEQLIEMYQRMLKRPLDSYESVIEETVEASNHSICYKEATQMIIRIPCDGNKYSIRFFSKNLNDSPTVDLRISSEIHGQISIEHRISNLKTAKAVNTATSMQNTYRHADEQLKKSKSSSE